jgi:hypothetical protein
MKSTYLATLAVVGAVVVCLSFWVLAGLGLWTLIKPCAPCTGAQELTERLDRMECELEYLSQRPIREYMLELGIGGNIHNCTKGEDK